MSAMTIGELDTVSLRTGHGRWLPGTTGTVVELLDAHTMLVELVGPDGATLDLLPVDVTDLQLVRHADTGPSQAAS
jgi:hypothetical protein